MAIPVYAGAGAGADFGGATTGNAPYPASIAAGDTLVLQLVNQSSGTTPALTTPSGWTEIGSVAASNGGPGVSQRCWVLPSAVGTESGSLALTGMSASTAKSARIYRFTGASNVESAANQLDSSGTTTTVNDCDITTTGADRLVVNVLAINNNDAIGAFSGMTGGTWVEAGAEYQNTGNVMELQLQTADKAAAGTVGGGTLGITTAAHWVVQGFALTPAASGTTVNAAVGIANASAVTPSFNALVPTIVRNITLNLSP